jgi:hypothetical protein
MNKTIDYSPALPEWGWALLSPAIVVLSAWICVGLMTVVLSGLHVSWMGPTCIATWGVSGLWTLERTGTYNEPGDCLVLFLGPLALCCASVGALLRICKLKLRKEQQLR